MVGAPHAAVSTSRDSSEDPLAIKKDDDTSTTSFSRAPSEATRSKRGIPRSSTVATVSSAVTRSLLRSDPKLNVVSNAGEIVQRAPNHHPRAWTAEEVKPNLSQCFHDNR